MPIPSILDYSDYRLFLCDCFERSKKRNKNWSYGAWAKKMNLRNNTSLLKIINGQREAGRKTQLLLSQYFKFNCEEVEYFRDLVELSKLKSSYKIIQSKKNISQKIFHQFDAPEAAANWSREVKQSIRRLKVHRITNYVNMNEFKLRSLVQFKCGNTNEINREYFQEHLVQREDLRLYSAIIHFVHKGGGRFKIYGEFDLGKEINIQYFNPVQDDNVLVNFCSVGFPTFSTYFYNMDHSAPPRFSKLSYSANKAVFTGARNRTYKRLKSEFLL